MNTVHKTLVYSNIWVGLAVVSLAAISLEPLFYIPRDFLAFVFFSTAFTYSYMRLVQIKNYDHYENGIKLWASNNPVLSWGYTTFLGGLALYFFLQVNIPGFLWLMILPGFISLLYPITFKNAFSGFTSLRTVPGIKMFLISLNWAYVTVLVPAALYMDVNTEIFLEFIFRVVLIIGLVIPFDIRDRTLDDLKMRTLPQVHGVHFSRQIAIFAIFVYQFWLLLRVLFFDYSVISAVALIIGFEFGAWLIRFASPKKKEAYFSIWIESVPIIAGLLLIIAHELL